MRELLLRELAAIIHQEVGAQKVLIAGRGAEGGLKVVAAHGYGDGRGERRTFVESFGRAQDEGTAESWANSEDAAVIRLEAANAAPALLVLAPRDATTAPARDSARPLGARGRDGA